MALFESFSGSFWTMPSSNTNEFILQDFSRLWSKAGHFSIALSKGAKTTTWIWNLHSDAHDFSIQQSSIARRKVFSSNYGHLSLLFFWISGMGLHGAYFANHYIWNKDPKHYLPSAALPSDIVNSDIGNYFQGYNITCGIFQLWRSMGIIGTIHLKYGSSASLCATIICIIGSYFHMHISCFDTKTSGCIAYRGLTNHHLSLLFGLSSISWSGHKIHIGLPANRLLDSGIDPVVIPCAQDFSFNCLEITRNPYVTIALIGCQTSTGGQIFGILRAHHFYLALVFITSSVIGHPSCSLSNQFRNALWNYCHGQLSINLLFAAMSSIVFGHHIYAQPIYPYIGSDYPTVLSLFYHHINIGGLLIIGAGAHASICSIIPDTQRYEFFFHRHLILGHLIYVALALGIHSFSLYIHNDTLQALYRPEDMFSDGGIQLKPVLGIVWAHFGIVSFDIKMLDKKVSGFTSELGTADFIVHHIHAFTIHIALLILSKGILYARNSRLVSDKLELGWRYPCDGPGRGGTCQISPYDQLYNAVFWMYNSLSIALLHYFWKMQSDVWGNLDLDNNSLRHISSGDWSYNSSTINGWLSNFLWSSAAQVIQSIGTSISSCGLIFICTHFIWAFSLMFLYSGRGYWQELIESILWAHHKLKIINLVQPRALSISQGRAVGLIHYTLGGVGSTWAFLISRMVVLSC